MLGKISHLTHTSRYEWQLHTCDAGMRLLYKLGLAALWIGACVVGYPLLIVLVWQLSPDSNFSVAGKVVMAVCAAGLAYSVWPLGKFISRR